MLMKLWSYGLLVVAAMNMCYSSAECNVDTFQIPFFPPPPLNMSHPTVQLMSMISKAGAKRVEAADKHATCHEWPCTSKSGNCRLCTPSLYIAGFSKCGTSALYAKLLSHPQIRKYWTKEVNIYNKRLSGLPHGTSLASLESYLKPKDDDINYHFLDGSAGTLRDLQSITLLKHFSPSTKVIVVVRDFHARLHSWLAQIATFRGNDNISERGERLIRAFYQLHVRNKVSMSLDVDYLQQYVFRGPLLGYMLMGQILIPWKQAFGDNLLVIDHADILRRPLVVLHSIEKFANLKRNTYDTEVLTSVANVRGKYGWSANTALNSTIITKNRQSIQFSRTRQLIVDKLFENSACVMEKLIGWQPKPEY